MTQDQYGQARGPGYVVRGEAVPEDETEEYTEQSKPKTTFQKVASALRGDRTDRDEMDRDEMDRDEMDQAPASRVTTASETATGSDVMAADPGTPGGGPPWVTERDEAAMANTPIAQETGDTADTAGTPAARPGGTAAATGAGTAQSDYWDEPGRTGTGQDEAVAVTNPDVPVTGTSTDPMASRDARDAAARPTGSDAVDHAATEPDMFGTTTRSGNGTAVSASPEDEAGAATIADVPAGGAAAGGTPVPAPAAEATETTGRHAAGTGAADTAAADTAAAGAGAAGEMRPGEEAGTLGDFSDLTYGNLIPDAAHYTEQWQQIQFRFVDDPQASVTEAADIVAQVTAKMEAAIQERQRAIEERQRAIQEQQRSLRGRWGEGTNTDTEALRATLRMYKTFLDQLIGPQAS